MLQQEPERTAILAEARLLVGTAGELRDYHCVCDPGGVRFSVKWPHEEFQVCYNLDELQAYLASRAHDAVPHPSDR